MSSFSLPLFALLATMACGDDDWPASGPQRLRGFVVVGNEVSAFQTCGSPRLMWLDLEGGEPGLEKLAPFTPPSCGISNVCSAYAELDAVVSASCKCGHLGKYERQLEMVKILDVRAEPPAGCAHAEPQYPQ